MKTRKTIQQELIFQILSESKHALSVDEILSLILQKPNKTTVYRVLERFKDSGKVHCVIDENGKGYYALCNDCDAMHHNHEHLHFQCRKCHKLECSSETIEIPKIKNYQIEDTQLLLVGLCSGCQT